VYSSLPTFWDKLSVPSSRVKKSKKKAGPYFAILQIHRLNPRKKKYSLGPFNGWKHQRFLTTQTRYQAILHDVQGDKGKKEAPTNQRVSAKKRETLNK